MSDNNVASEGLINLIRSIPTKLIFLVFVVLIIVTSVLFLLLYENWQSTIRSELIEFSRTKTEIKDIGSQLDVETQKSLNRALLYRMANGEIDRFEAIYALKSSKELYDDYSRSTLPYTSNEDISDLVQQLGNDLRVFDQQIAASLNNDGRLKAIIDHAFQDSDSASARFMFNDSIIDTNVGEAKSLASAQERISNGLLILDSRLGFLIRAEVARINATNPLWINVVFILVLVLFLLLLSYLMVKKLSSSIAAMRQILGKIAVGELPEEQSGHLGEFEKIVDAGNELVQYLDDASRFTMKIGEGDFQYTFRAKSEKDTLGNSLIDMRDKLQQVAREDQIRNWMNEGHAKFAQILRQYSNDIEQLGRNTIMQLVDYLGASLGAIFLLNEEGEEKYLDLLATCAFQREKYTQKRLGIGQGLAGRAYQEGKTIYITDVRSDHYEIQTGLGTSSPSSILIIPLKNEEGIEGVVELASSNAFEKYQIEFVEQVGQGIASSLRAGKISETTKTLLADSQEKAEAMRAQEEELRQNMEELAATQEQVERRNKELEEIQDRLNEEKYLLSALLETTSDRIYFKDRKSKFIRVSKSMIELFGKHEESEILGKTDFDFGFEEHAKTAFADEQQILETGKPLVDAIEKEEWDDGRVGWVSTTKNPLRNTNGEIVGTFGISRDVTKNQAAEVAMHQRNEWLEYFFRFQATSFVVLDQKGQVQFIASSLTDELKKGDDNEMFFEDVFKDITFEKFLVEIDHGNTWDRPMEVALAIKSVKKKIVRFKAISVANDGACSIFLIQV